MSIFSINNIIIAPHVDDEVIGCYSILKKEKCQIIYTNTPNEIRLNEANNLKNYLNVNQLFCDNIPSIHLSKSKTYYIPHPIYEIHPEHRKWGAIGENMARDGYNVIFYSTNMNAPFIREEQYANDKKILLDKVYKSQSDLWKYDHKYFLFCGFCKWIF